MLVQDSPRFTQDRNASSTITKHQECRSRKGKVWTHGRGNQTSGTARAGTAVEGGEHFFFHLMLQSFCIKATSIISINIPHLRFSQSTQLTDNRGSQHGVLVPDTEVTEVTAEWVHYPQQIISVITLLLGGSLPSVAIQYKDTFRVMGKKYRISSRKLEKPGPYTLLFPTIRVPQMRGCTVFVTLFCKIFSASPFPLRASLALNESVLLRSVPRSQFTARLGFG